jgi:hypothetical protein
MGGGRRCRTSVVMFGALVLAGLEARPARGQEGAPPAAGGGVEPVVRDTDLAALGSAARWRALIAGDGSLPRHERVIVTDGAGRILMQAEGGDRRVAIPPQWMPALRERGAGLILAHNHPDGHSLSVDDLWQFEKRGVAIVVALGHDGSLYAAAEGPLYWRASVPALYMAASREVERQVRLHKVGAGALLVHRNHLVALALARAGVIVYRCDLAPRRARAFASYARPFDDIVRAAEARVRELLGRDGAQAARAAETAARSSSIEVPWVWNRSQASPARQPAGAAGARYRAARGT